MRLRALLLLPALLGLALSTPGGSARAADGPVLHEQIPPDPHEDIAMSVALDGDLPAAIDTKSGVVQAPDPRAPIPGDAGAGAADREDPTFKPDRNTKRPDIQGYEEPFTPSTAPFKRLEAFDAVSATYDLFVRDKRLQTMPTSGGPVAANEEQFYGDLVVDVAPGKKTRVPSVGPGARIVRARLGVGSQDLSVHAWRDGADNWFVESIGGTARARLVMQLAIARGVFGGEFGDPSYADLPKVPPLPENVQRSAREVMGVIGVSSTLKPRENITKMVTYFRGFADSEDPPRGRADIYLDLALSRKGVCRHRAFAFLVTSLALQIPARMVINEAHAWVEVHDSIMWRRIDLGGAGRMTNPASNALPERAVHQPPPDSFQWPQGSEPGQEMVDEARSRAHANQPGPGDPANGSPNGASSSSLSPSATPAPSGSGGPSGTNTNAGDERPVSTVTLTVQGPSAHRGQPLRVSGDVKAESEICANVMVEISLRDLKDPSRLLLVGSIATSEKGTYTGSIVVPGVIPLGDYDVVARTSGDARCGRGASP